MTEYWPNWKSLPPRQKEDAWEEFKGKYYWAPEIDEATARYVFDEQAHKLFRDHIGTTKRNYYTNRLAAGQQPSTPTWMTEEVFGQFCEYWGSDAAKAISNQAKANRAGSSGSAAMHTMGTIPVAEHHDRMEREHGQNISFVDVYASTHLRNPTAPDQPPQWVDDRSANAFRAYQAAVVPEGTPPDEPVPFVPDVWHPVASEGHPKRGARVLGMGDYGRQCPSTSTGRRRNVALPTFHDSRVDTLEAALEEERRERAKLADALAVQTQMQEENDRRHAETQRQLALLMAHIGQDPQGNFRPPPS